MTEKKYIKHIGSRDFYEISHPFADRKDKYLSGKHNYKCIILGTFPSEKSEENGFFYSNRSNALWKILGEVCGEKNFVEMKVEEKEKWLDGKGIALYDIVESYEGRKWFSNDIALFACGENHKYCLEFLYDFLMRFPKAKVMVTSREVEKRFKSYFVCQGRKEVNRTEKNRFFENVQNEQIIYLPSPSQSNRSSTKERKEKDWKKGLEQARIIR
ncbi:uracil-DNA glycosylase family protein [Helicobacter pametensis]|uniref:uracil-DNA glycosylase family protein n=1 Tax=Helicobacter pametensis TaxID=95149 RepID=UPI0004B0BCED|nr:uracil-DNA glycosylase family protein [Helicobacter pametensis]